MKTLLAQVAFCVLLCIVAYSIATEYAYYNAWFNENIAYANYLSRQLTNMGIYNTISNNFDISIRDTELLPKLSTPKSDDSKFSTLLLSIYTKDLEMVIAKIAHILQNNRFISASISSLTIRAIKNTAPELDHSQIHPSITFKITHSDEAKKLMEKVNQEAKESTINSTLF